MRTCTPRGRPLGAARWIHVTRAGVMALSLAAPLSAQNSRDLTLTVEQAVDLALAQSERVVLAAATVDQARGSVEETRSRALPSVDFAYNYARNLQRPAIFFNQGGQIQQITVGEAHDNAFALNLRQTLFDPTLPSALSAASEARDLAAATEEDVRRQVALAVRLAYFQVLLNRELVEVREAALDQAGARLEQVGERARAGLGSEFDTLTALVNRDNLRPPLIEARNNLAQSMDRLKRELGMSLESTLTLTDSLSYEGSTLPPTMDVDSIVSGRADVRAARQEIALRRSALTAEERSPLPTVSLTAGLQRRASSEDFTPTNRDFVQSFAIGAEVSWPLFDGRASSGRALQFEAQLRQAQARLEGVEADARLALEAARQDLEAADTLVQSSRTTLTLAERALEIAQIRFASGLSTQLEIGEAELQLTQARTNLSQALFSYNAARARWEAARGRIR